VQQPDQLPSPRIRFRLFNRRNSRSTEYSPYQHPGQDRSAASHAPQEYQKLNFPPPSPPRLDELSVKIVTHEATARAAIPFAPRDARRLIVNSISAKPRRLRPIEAARNRV
jgi:hypothetical protein